MVKAGWFAAAAAAIGAVVAWHEWSYRHTHPHHAGPAVWIALTGLAVAVTAAALVWVIDELDEVKARSTRRDS